MTSPVHVLLNPSAGRAAGLRARLERGLAERSVDFELHFTEGPGHARELAGSAADQGAPMVVAVGGDGTVHEAADGLLMGVAEGDSTRTSLAVVPAGTGNDFAKLIPGLVGFERALDAVAAGRTLPFDAGRASWEGGQEHFVNGAGTGIDVEVVRQVRRMRSLPGVLTYAVALGRALRRFRPVQLTVRADGADVSRRVMILAVGNGACIGGGFRVCPPARPDDGVLDLCIVRELGVFGIARTVPRVLRGTHGRLPDVVMRRVREVRIESEGGTALYFQLDGELREPAAATWLHIAVRPGVLRVVAPAVTAPAAASAATLRAARAAGGA